MFDFHPIDENGIQHLLEKYRQEAAMTALRNSAVLASEEAARAKASADTMERLAKRRAASSSSTAGATATKAVPPEESPKRKQREAARAEARRSRTMSKEVVVDSHLLWSKEIPE